jgi:hypothetical protein
MTCTHFAIAEHPGVGSLLDTCAWRLGGHYSLEQCPDFDGLARLPVGHHRHEGV